MRIGIVGLWHETNSYGPNPADLRAFEHFELIEGGDVISRHSGTRTVIGGFLSRGDVEYVPLLSAGAWPSGPAPTSLVRALHARIGVLLREAGPLDGVLVNLHGAMATSDIPDVEAETVQSIRAVVGDIPLAAVLDLHANPSATFVASTDIVLSYDTYPHVDMYERGAEACELLVEAIQGRKFVTVVAKAPILTCPLVQGTDDEPMQGIVRRARERARDAGIARVGITAGFAYTDVDRAGISVLVVADRAEVKSARRLANETITDVEQHASEFEVDRPDADEAVRLVLENPMRPTVLVDVADNIGGGSAGDGTDLLEALVRRAAPSAVVVIADRDAVAHAVRVGVGGVDTFRIGAKADSLHGATVTIDAEVEAVTNGRFVSHGSYMTGQVVNMGLSVRLRAAGVHIVLTEVATPPFHREHLTSMGVVPEHVDVIVAKGAIAWKAAIEHPARVVEVSTHGACPIDMKLLDRTVMPVGHRA